MKYSCSQNITKFGKSQTRCTINSNTHKYQFHPNLVYICRFYLNFGKIKQLPAQYWSTKNINKKPSLICVQSTVWNIIVLIWVKSVPLTLCKAQVHGGEEQEKEKSLELHGCCSSCVVRCTETKWLNQRAKTSTLEAVPPRHLVNVGSWCNVFHHNPPPSTLLWERGVMSLTLD